MSEKLRRFWFWAGLLTIVAWIICGSSTLALAQVGDGGNSVVVKAQDVTAKVTVSGAYSYSGHQLGVAVDFDVAPGWHIYGAPLPPEYTVTKITFNDTLVQSQSIKFPAPTPLKFEALNQTFPVYSGNFKAAGTILLRQKLTPGDYQLGGTIDFQQCNDVECKIPQSVKFELPLKIEPLAGPAPKA